MTWRLLQASADVGGTRLVEVVAGLPIFCRGLVSKVKAACCQREQRKACNKTQALVGGSQPIFKRALTSEAQRAGCL